MHRDMVERVLVAEAARRMGVGAWKAEMLQARMRWESLTWAPWVERGLWVAVLLPLNFVVATVAGGMRLWWQAFVVGAAVALLVALAINRWERWKVLGARKR